jgi:hypothetical protein
MNTYTNFFISIFTKKIIEEEIQFSLRVKTLFFVCRKVTQDPGTSTKIKGYVIEEEKKAYLFFKQVFNNNNVFFII